MKYKRLFLGICLTLLVVISQAQELCYRSSNSGERSVLITISAIGNPDIVTGVEILVLTCYTSNSQVPTEISF